MRAAVLRVMLLSDTTAPSPELSVVSSSRRLATPLDRSGWFTVGMQLFVSLAAASFWLTWYFGDRTLVATSGSPEYLSFQSNFLVADVWMIFGCLAGARALVRGRSSALLWILQSSSCAVFLGAMDVSYDLRHGIYLSWQPGLVSEILINAMSFGCGGWGLWFGWTRRRHFISLDSTEA